MAKTKNQKEFCIENSFGIDPKKDHWTCLYLALTQEDQFKKAEFERKMIEVFETNSFKIKRGIKFNENNPNSIGIESSYDPSPDFFDEMDKKAKKENAQFPEKYSLKEMLNNDVPIVAKLKGANGGESKCLLRTIEEKYRFLISNTINNQYLFRLLDENISPKERLEKALISVNEKRRVLEHLVKGKAIDEKDKKQIGYLDKFYCFQEFIQNSPELNSSYRILIDAKGKIYYISLHTSKFEEKPKDKIWERFQGGLREVSRFKDCPNHPWEKEYWRDTASIFKDHPGSPLFIPNHHIVSNRVQGGKAIILYNNSKEIAEYSKEEKEILKKVGLSEENPQIPKKIINLTKRLAHTFRGETPYGGADFITDKNQNFFFLEYNILPEINPNILYFEGIDMSKKYEVQLEMAKRVASKY